MLEKKVQKFLIFENTEVHSVEGFISNNDLIIFYKSLCSNLIKQVILHT